MSNFLKRGVTLIILMAVLLTPPQENVIYFGFLAISLIFASWMMLGKTGFWLSLIGTTMAGGANVTGWGNYTNDVVLQTAGNILISISGMILFLKWQTILFEGFLSDGLDFLIEKIVPQNRVSWAILMISPALLWVTITYMAVDMWMDTRMDSWGLYIWILVVAIKTVQLTKMLWPSIIENMFVKTEVRYSTFVTFLIGSYWPVAYGFQKSGLRLEGAELALVNLGVNLVSWIMFRMISCESKGRSLIPKFTFLEFILMGAGAIWLLTGADHRESNVYYLGNAFMALAMVSASSKLSSDEIPWYYINRMNYPRWLDAGIPTLTMLVAVSLSATIIMCGYANMLWFMVVMTYIVTKYTIQYLTILSNES